MAGIDEVADPDMRLVDGIAVQASGILLQRAFPGDRHRQYECVQWRMIESLADQPASREQYARLVCRKGVEVSQQRCALPG